MRTKIDASKTGASSCCDASGADGWAVTFETVDGTKLCSTSSVCATKTDEPSRPNRTACSDNVPGAGVSAAGCGVDSFDDCLEACEFFEACEAWDVCEAVLAEAEGAREVWEAVGSLFDDELLEACETVGVTGVAFVVDAWDGVKVCNLMLFDFGELPLLLKIIVAYKPLLITIWRLLDELVDNFESGLVTFALLALVSFNVFAFEADGDFNSAAIDSASLAIADSKAVANSLTKSFSLNTVLFSLFSPFSSVLSSWITIKFHIINHILK